jgi:hypothetical protein
MFPPSVYWQLQGQPRLLYSHSRAVAEVDAHT